MLLDYALRASRGIDSLAITHFDALARFSQYQACVRYEGIEELALPGSMAEQERLTATLASARPRYEPMGRTPQEFCGMLHEHARFRVRYRSSGMTAGTVIENQ